MTVFHVAYKNMLRKKNRSLLTVVGIALSAWVLVSLFGFNKGYEASLNRDIDNLGFQVLVTAKGCPYEAATLMLKGGIGLRYMDERILGDIRKYPEVEAVTPMLMHAIFDPNKGESGGISSYLGVDPSTFPRLKAFLEFRQGSWFSDPLGREAVLGYEAAELEQREVGDSLLIPETDVSLKVTGILKRTGTQDDGTIFVPIRTIQNLFDKKDRLTGVGVKVDKRADIAALEEQLYNLTDVQVVSLAQVKQTIVGLISTARVIVLSIAAIAIAIAMIGVVNTILMSVLERFQEIGILKSLGAQAEHVFALVWAETLMLCLAGSLLGTGLALVLSRTTGWLVRRILPYTPTGGVVSIDWKLALTAIALVLAVGMASGLYPSWKASRIRPLEAIRREE